MINYSPTSLSQIIDWRIKNIPIYRILDNRQWMVNFFEKGEIQVSCFNKFRNYKDEMKGDNTEGKATLCLDDQSGDTHLLEYEAGLNAYILSTTRELTKEVINDFKGTCAIKINYPTLFGLELSKKLPFVSSGLEGSCDYVDSKIHFLNKYTDTRYLIEFLKQKRHLELNHEMDKLTMGMELFAKHEKYKHQSEYRLVWFGKKEISENFTALCPELIEYCEPIEL